MPYLTIDNFKLYYEDQGQGAPLLLIAGLKCDSRIWTLVLEELKKNFRVISFDNRGIGKSDNIDTPITINSMADDAFKLLDHLGIQKAFVIGHSMGGTIAQTMAYLAPERIQKLVISNSLVKVNLTNRFLVSIFILIRYFGFNPQRLMKRAVPLLFAKQFRKNKAQVEEITAAFLEKRNASQALTNYSRQLEALLSFNSRNWLSKITSPTLVIEGREDRICPRDSKILAKHISQSQLVSLVNVGHVPMLEKPHNFVKILNDFLIPHC